MDMVAAVQVLRTQTQNRPTREVCEVPINVQPHNSEEGALRKFHAEVVISCSARMETQLVGELDLNTKWRLALPSQGAMLLFWISKTVSSRPLSQFREFQKISFSAEIVHAQKLRPGSGKCPVTMRRSRPTIWNDAALDNSIWRDLAWNSVTPQPLRTGHEPLWMGLIQFKVAILLEEMSAFLRLNHLFLVSHAGKSSAWLEIDVMNFLRSH